MNRPIASPVAHTRWLVLGVFAATLIAYLPSLSGDFLWDDDGHVTTPGLRSLSGLVRIWFEPGITQQYYPLTHSAFWLESQLWGDHPLGYRLINVVLHATSACLFAGLLRRLAVPGAWLAAFLFALHPVCVESVAWISEQKNTLSLVFYLSAALAYLRFTESRRSATYVGATTLFAAALLSKTVTSTLPAALLVIAWWRHGRLEWRRDVALLLPWFALSAAAALMTSWFETVFIGAQGTPFALSWLERSLLAGRIVWFYLGKLLWPANLTFIYPRWEMDSSVPWQWLFAIAAIALTLFLLLRRHRGALACWLLFVGSLTPALGFINVYPFIYSYVADHFQYLASLALIAAGAASLTHGFQKIPRPASLALLVALPLLFGILTMRQSRMYQDEVTLYETTLQRNPACWMAHTNLAKIFTDNGQPLDAVPHLEQALQLRPNYPEGENNFGHTLTVLGRPREALPHLERAIALQPKYTTAFNNLGLAYTALGNLDAAMDAFRKAIQLDPLDAGAHFNLGLALAQSKKTADAVAHFEKAVTLRPLYADAELNWAIGLMLSGSFPAAIPHFERAIALRPDSARYLAMYGRALANAGRTQEAIERFRAALDLAPDDANIHVDLSFALRKLGQLKEAAEHQAEAQRLRGNPSGTGR